MHDRSRTHAPVHLNVKHSSDPVHLIHDVLMDFLNEPQYVQYNIDYFNVNPEMA